MTEAENSTAQSTDEIRRVLAEGFAFVRGNEATESVSAASFEECLAQAIQEIEGDESSIRPGRLTAVRSMKQRVIDTIDRALEMSPDLFVMVDSSANTRADGSGQAGDES